MPALYGYSQGYFQARGQRQGDLTEVYDLKSPLFAWYALRTWNQPLALPLIHLITTWPKHWSHESAHPKPKPVDGTRLWLNTTALLMMGTDVELKGSLPAQGLSAIVSQNRLGIHHVSIKNKEKKRIILITIAPLTEYWGFGARFPAVLMDLPRNPTVYEAGRNFRWHTLTQQSIESTDPTKPTGFTLKWLVDEVIDKAHNFDPWLETFEKKKIREIEGEYDKYRGAPPPTRHPPDPYGPTW
jgi:hypothetical protein